MVLFGVLTFSLTVIQELLPVLYFTVLIWWLVW